MGGNYIFWNHWFFINDNDRHHIICQMKMTPIHIVQQKCWDNDIYVRVLPTQRGYKKGGYPVTLNLEKAGRIVKYGTMPFNQNSDELTHKIHEIYRNEYQRFK